MHSIASGFTMRIYIFFLIVVGSIILLLKFDK